MRRVNPGGDVAKKNYSTDLSVITDYKGTGDSQVSSHFGGSALLFGGFLFFYSWVHLYYYFQTFGVSLALLDVSIYFYLAFAWTVVRELGVVGFIALLIGTVIYVVLNQTWKRDADPRVDCLHKIVFAWFLLIGLYGTFAIAQNQGTLQAQQARDGEILKTIRINFERNAEKRFPAILRGDLKGVSLNSSQVMNVKLLVETKGQYFILLQRVSEGGEYMGYGSVYSVPKKYVASIEISIPNSVRVESVIQPVENFLFD